MSTVALSQGSDESRARAKEYPAGGLRFDWTFIVLAALLIGGLEIDGWAHFHGMVDDSFFTPWHGLFYSAFAIVSGFLAFHQYRNLNKGYVWGRALPRGYTLSLLGAVIFALGGVADLIWHTLFGIEVGTEALMSPSHLMLAIGMALIVTGPVRAAWFRAESRGWLALFPALIGATLFLLLLEFFTGYVHPHINPLAAFSSPSESEEVELRPELYVMNIDGTGQTRLTVNPEVGYAMAAWSPDGTQIVYVAGSPYADEGSSALYIMNADGTNAVQLTNFEGRTADPTWSPDGQRIAFSGEINGVRDIYTINADGSDLLQITNTPEGDWSPAWSPDGTQLVMAVETSTNHFLLHILSVDGSSDVTLPIAGSSGLPSWSPDGSRIAYVSQRDGDNELYTARPDGSDEIRLTNNEGFDGFAVWTPDGESIVFMSWRGGDNEELYIMPATGETEEHLAVNLSRNPALAGFDPAVSPDGTRILFTALSAGSDSSGSTVSAQDAGVTGIVLQAVFVAGVPLVLARRWMLPFGALTLVLTLGTLLMVVLSDLYILAIPAFISGAIADVLVWRLKPSQANISGFGLFGFLVPAVYFATYIVTLMLVFGGIGWSIHVWGGAIFVAGLMGLLLSYLVALPYRAGEKSMQAA